MWFFTSHISCGCASSYISFPNRSGLVEFQTSIFCSSIVCYSTLRLILSKAISIIGLDTISASNNCNTSSIEMKHQRSRSLNDLTDLTNDTPLKRPTLNFNILTNNYIFLMPDNYEQLVPPSCNNTFVTTHSEFNLIKQNFYWYKPRLLAELNAIN